MQAERLLLDEWDANLDPVNQKRISGLLEERAQTACILEVCHRRDRSETEETEETKEPKEPKER
ncbi:MAG TPA: hypothetical protein IAC37_13310 [Candidatus Ventrimonas merdavium]|nr:hypothetical protein [Candidatus Ventrimonas merdavium]